MDIISSNIYTAVGLFGVLTYLVNYTCLQMGLVSGQSYLYAGVVILGASSILVSLLDNFNLPTAVIQGSFILISLVGIIRLYISENHIFFSPEESHFFSTKFPNLPKNLARKLFDKGYWLDGGPGSVLAYQGENLNALIYIADGEAAICIDGKTIGYAGKESFIGEITVLDDAPATATVTLSKPSRYFAIDKSEFKKLVLRYPEIHAQFTHSFAGEMKKRLLERHVDLIRLQRLLQED